MKKKNLLFVMPSLSAGGGEKSLVNLLSQINFDLYNVDLFLFSEKGELFTLLPKEVNVIKPKKNHLIFTTELKNSLGSFLNNRQFHLAYSRIMFTIKNRLIKNSNISEQYTWKYMSVSFDILEKEYDVAIGYLEKSSIYFVVDKVKSKKKIGWIHTNYSNSGMNYKYDNPYFKQLDKIVTVSQECANALTENFPDLNNKIKVIFNIISPKMIRKLSNEEIQDTYLYEKKYINIVTVARLSKEKGIDQAIKSCKILVNKGHDIKWYVIGEGNERERLEQIINNNNLNNNFKLLGIRENPYPYIKKADIYVQPSRYEGKSIAIDEAKILGKPIIVTNYRSAKDQIVNGVNGQIVEMSEEGLSLGIEQLIKEEEIKDNLVSNLAKEKLGTEEEINKVYAMF
ncbi:glycosyltransferase [Metabacillus halosaccharovorans]|uniref:glycosyltransferase n=1 Tax=Metabacillus halosaccharovorans TaxID=930124 RepID=UPI001C1FB457|nr:glycosyltransferase [Metabacillus halosaccharovorans]MBU7593517.1 glycosyltransferase [Metabacillus halosaccharovorans]